jgi:membrane-associated phospholipid phosphatase
MGSAALRVGAYVSVSRMVDNKHWASDVIFGTAIGIVSGRAASLATASTRVGRTRDAARRCYRPIVGCYSS